MKLKALLLLVILILFSATAYYFLSGYRKNTSDKQVSSRSTATQKDDTLSDTDTFTDARKIITFRYPKNSKQVGGVSPSPLGGIAFQAHYDETEHLFSGITIIATPILQEDSRFSWEEFKNRQDPYNTGDSDVFVYTDLREISVAGERALTYLEGTKDKDLMGRFVIFRHGGLKYSIGVGGNRVDIMTETRINEAVDMITKTFRFLK